MAQHTLGPWIVEGNWVYASNENKHNKFVIQIHPGCYCNKCKVINSTELDANIQLIAAAPDLLESLKRFVERPGVPPLETDIIFAKQAIVKAEGK